MAVLDRGRVLQVGAPQEIYRRPGCRMVADFIGETDFIVGTLVGGEGGRLLVDTALGRFEGVLGAGSAPPPGGSAVTLSIRPECWKLSRTPPVRNACLGRAVYLGEMAQYNLRAGDQELKVLELNPRFFERLDGDEVFVSAEPEDVVILVT